MPHLVDGEREPLSSLRDGAPRGERRAAAVAHQEREVVAAVDAVACATVLVVGKNSPNMMRMNARMNGEQVMKPFAADLFEQRFGERRFVVPQRRRRGRIGQHVRRGGMQRDHHLAVEQPHEQRLRRAGPPRARRCRATRSCRSGAAPDTRLGRPRAAAAARSRADRRTKRERKAWTWGRVPVRSARARRRRYGCRDRPSGTRSCCRRTRG